MKNLLKQNHKYIIAIVLGCATLAIPLLRDFHFESALLAAVVGCFWAGLSACTQSEKPDFFEGLHILGFLYVFSIILLVHTIINNCFSSHGLGFWLLLPVPSVFFGYSIGRLLRIWNIGYRRLITVLILLAVGIGGWLVELYNLPQVYFFNHVWGYWPGPIYDETIQLTGSLFFYRGITLLWIVLLWFLPSFSEGTEAKWIVVLSVLGIMLSYSYMSEAGVITPRSYLKQQLSSQVKSSHFNIYYDERFYSKDEIKRIALEHEFYYRQISDRLELKKSDQKIESYLYSHPWQKKKLVGAKFTSYVPVWLDQDQLHIAKQQIQSSLKHELVHVMAKQFGNKLFNASWSIGLIEGLATAVGGGHSPTSTLDQIVAAEEPLPGVEEMVATLSPSGFYSGRSTVGYITMGSFVNYLLDEYPVSNFKKAYRTADISLAYGKEMSELVDGWHRRLESTALDSTDQQQARQLFGIPSLFEKECPHIISDFGEAWDHYQFKLAERDTSEALKYLTKAKAFQPKNLRVKTEWAYQNLKAGKVFPVQYEANTQDSSAELQMLYADAFALEGEFSVAQNHIAKSASLISQDSLEDLNDALATRTDQQQWKLYLNMTYKQHTLSEEEFRAAYYRTKIRAVEQVILKEQWRMLSSYSQELLELPWDKKYMGRYISMVHWLGYIQEFELADSWSEKLENEQLRPRHEQLLSEQEEWIAFLRSQQ